MKFLKSAILFFVASVITFNISAQATPAKTEDKKPNTTTETKTTTTTKTKPAPKASKTKETTTTTTKTTEKIATKK